MGGSAERNRYFNGRGREIRGVSLLEVLIGLVLGGLVAAALYEFFATQQRSYRHQDEAAEMHQNLRVAMEQISRDLTMAGFGKPAWSIINGVDLSPWYNSTNGYVPVKGGTSLDIIGCSTVADGTISDMKLEPDHAEIILAQSTKAVDDNFNSSNRSDISIGGCESGKVTNVTNSTLTIKPSPTRRYDAGTEVFVLRHITYSTGISGGTPALFVDNHLSGHRQALCQFITGLEASVNGNVVSVTLTGQSRNPDRTTGRHLTSTMRAAITLRNQ